MARKVERARVYVHSTFNNTILTLTDTDGQVLTWVSPGVVGFKGSRKGTPYAAQMAAERLLERMKEFGVRSVTILVKGTGSGRNSVIQTLKGSGIRVEEVKNITPVAHN
ncbi:TPA: 30S ribosomal protein S11 [Candidatus Bipolaricaulota bacterium]|nr:30S ribosomal protein S11 [Candidatus Bipolaricaulota bacterium]